MKSVLKILIIIMVSATFNNVAAQTDWTVTGNETINTEVTYDNVTITTGSITIVDGGILTVNSTLTNTDVTKLIIEEGGQLRNKSADVKATMKKSIKAYGSDENAHWYTISMPNTTPIKDGAFVSGNTLEDFDLYYYKEPEALWYSYKAHDGDNLFKRKQLGYGYLYAYKYNTTFELSGVLNQSDYTVKLTVNNSGSLKGFTLLGNPYPHDIYKGKLGEEQTAIGTGGLASGYYVLDGNSSWIPCGFDEPIKPFQGILVKATQAEKNKIIENKWTAPDSDKEFQNKDISLVLNVKGNSGEDRAYIYFFEGVGLDKIDHLSDNVPNLSVLYNDTKYAISHVTNECNSIDVLFDSNQHEFFTITVEPENGGFTYLHLIDNLTGDDIDLLQEPSYRFASSGNDYDSRFKLIVKQNNDVSSDNSSFAYLSNDDIIVTGVQGMATLQIFDVMGRMVSSNVITGTDGSVCRVRKPYSTGVYILRLIENNNASTQKIVVE